MFKTISLEVKSAQEGYDLLKSVKGTKAGFIENGIKNFSITKEDLVEQKGLVLPTNVRAQLVKLLALGYNSNSKVGEVTNDLTAVCTARPEEFFDENGLLDKDLFCKAFKTADRINGTVSQYKSIFVEDENVFSFVLHYDNRYKVVAHYVSNDEINEFARRISKLDLNKITPEDIVRIQGDLWYLFRAWQESSIDVVKDKSKAFKKAFDSIIGKISVRTRMKFRDIITNEFSIKAAKYSDAEIPRFAIDFGVYDDDCNPYGVKYVETKLSDFQDSIRNTLQDKIDDIVDVYLDTNMSVYKKYTKYAHKYPELALTVANVLKLVRDYNNTTKEEKREGKKLNTKDFAILRAVIFNDADSLDIDRDDVVKVAIGTACVDVYVDRGGNIVIKDFNEKKASDNMDYIEKIFGNMMLIEDAEIFGVEDMVYDHMIKTEIEPFHVFENVEPGIYSMINGDVFSDEGELLFDTMEDYNGDVEVTEEGTVVYYYDPVDEVSELPDIDFILSNQMLDAEGKIDLDGETRGLALDGKLDTIEGKINMTIDAALKDDGLEYGIAVIDNNSYFEVDSTVKPGEYRFNKFYGIGGARIISSIDEDGDEIIKQIKRNNMFLFLEYDEAEMKNYIQKVTMFME